MTFRKFYRSCLAIIALSLYVTAVASANGNYNVAEQPTVASSSSTASLVEALQVKTEYDHVGTFVAVSKSKIKRVKKSGKLKCFTRYGTWLNSLYENGYKFGTYEETSRAKFCELKKPIRKAGVTFTHVKVAGGKSGKPCYNLAIPPKEGNKKQKLPKPTLTGTVMDYASLQFDLEFELKGDAKVAATATCVNGSSYASASAYGAGAFATRIKIRVSSKSKFTAKANAKSAELSISQERHQSVKTSAIGDANLDLRANAIVKCGGGQETKVYVCPQGNVYDGEKCVKDGSTTPAPPSNAPGPNPQPSPDEPHPGGYACYKETDNSPVEPENGKCPTGSYGQPVETQSRSMQVLYKPGEKSHDFMLA